LSQFYNDLKNANITERELAKVIEEKLDCKTIEFNDDNRYDIKFKGKIDFTVEVKEDFITKTTGNIGVEYHSRGKDSGINTTQAHFYLYKTHTSNSKYELLLMKTKELKKIIKEKKYFRVVNGGDFGSNTMMYIFKLDEIRRISIKLN